MIAIKPTNFGDDDKMPSFKIKRTQISEMSKISVLVKFLYILLNLVVK